uniref:ELMO domain-containing protein n=1 Tax=Brassica campestris TaxID=3711 RepID=M4C835_BRACM
MSSLLSLISCKLQQDCVLLIVEGVPGSAAWLGRGLSCVCAQRRDSDAHSTFDLTPAQEECLQRLQNRIDVAYDTTIPLHQEALRNLWKLSFPEEELHGLISEQWKEMGWQGKDPSTDFRGGGFISLENLMYFARTHMLPLQTFLTSFCNAACPYAAEILPGPFEEAGWGKMLDLEAVKPRTIVGATFLKFLSENESAFDILYCIAFKLMDQQWLSMHASYMEFNTVMKSTRRQLERELMLEDITHLEDLPSYALLSQ